MPQLKYLFLVEYTDGSMFEQNSDDVSSKDPKRSAFFDVDLDRVKKFHLIGPEHRYAVDLTTGEFEHDGVSFAALPFSMWPGQPEKLELVFFRRRQHDVNINAKFVDGKWVQVGDAEKGEERTAYYLGWQAKLGGKNHQQIIGVK